MHLKNIQYHLYNGTRLMRQFNADFLANWGIKCVKVPILEAPCQCQDVSIAYNIKMYERQKQTSNLIKGHLFTMFGFLFDSSNSVLGKKKSICKEEELLNTNRTTSLNCWLEKPRLGRRTLRWSTTPTHVDLILKKPHRAQHGHSLPFSWRSFLISITSLAKLKWRDTNCLN